MPDDLLTSYHQLLTVMDQAVGTLDRKDLPEVCALDAQLSALLVEIAARSAAWTAAPPDAGAVAGLEAVIRSALARTSRLQEQLAAWLAETGEELGRVCRGAAAVSGYAAHHEESE